MISYLIWPGLVVYAIPKAAIDGKRREAGSPVKQPRRVLGAPRKTSVHVILELYFAEITDGQVEPEEVLHASRAVAAVAEVLDVLAHSIRG